MGTQLSSNPAIKSAFLKIWPQYVVSRPLISFLIRIEYSGFYVGFYVKPILNSILLLKDALVFL